MKKLICILAVMLLVPSLAFALSLTISASTTSGTNLGNHFVLKCKGYLFAADPNINPWDTANCQQLGSVATLSFGTLSTVLQKSDGTDGAGAGCFYARDFFIVYLYPDAWGGKGYELKQSAVTTFSSAIANSVIMTPVYSPDDRLSPTDPVQGPLIAGEDDGDPVLARLGGLILKSKRGRIVRAQYSIPPNKADGTDWVSGWDPVSLSTGAGSYTSGAITISITEWQ